MSLLKKLSIMFLAACAAFQLHAQTVAYVTSQSGTVSVIDTSTKMVTATITVGNFPLGLVFSPDGARAYFANLGDGTVSVLDTASNTVVATVTLPGNPASMEILFPAITPDGKALYVPDAGNNVVDVVNTISNTVSTSIGVGSAPSEVVMAPDGARAYVMNSNDGTVSVINTATNTLVGPPISVDSALSGGPVFLAITPDGSHLYVGSDGDTVITVVTTATNATASVSVPSGSFGLAVTPDGSRVYVADEANNAVSVIATADNSVQPDLIPVGSGPIDVAITPDGSFVYVTNFFDGTVSVIATASNMVVATVPVATIPFGIAIANVTPPPTAVAGPNQTITVDQTVHLDGSGSFAPNTLPANLQYAWSFVSRPAGSSAVLNNANTATPNFIADAVGNFVVQLVVTDPADNKVSAPSQVTVSSIWSPPTANAGAAQSVTTGALVQLNGLGSTDPNGLPLTYAWSFVSKPNGSAATITPGTIGLASFTTDVAGSYSVQLVVSDAFGSSSPSTVIITATTPETAQQLIQDAINYIAAMPASHFDSPGHSNALTNQLQQAIADVQQGKTSQAIGKLNDSIIRTDGFPLRGALDGNGPGMDWITNQTDQNFAYAKLTAALSALQ